jgi:hypothetical protein
MVAERNQKTATAPAPIQKKKKKTKRKEINKLNIGLTQLYV